LQVEKSHKKNLNSNYEFIWQLLVMTKKSKVKSKGKLTFEFSGWIVCNITITSNIKVENNIKKVKTPPTSLIYDSFDILSIASNFYVREHTETFKVF
jgi:hypothetical protein